MNKSKLFLMVLGSLGVLMQGTANAAPEVQESAVLRNSGEIRGVVDFCGPQGESGTKVFLAGESFYISTDASGQFLFTYVPQGSHDLIIEVDGQAPVPNVVQVFAKSITNLGTVIICQDSDNDGFTPASDCNDLNAAINPGAIEICDNVDNNCDGNVDEGCVTCTDGDNDGFFAQASCGSPVDCDDGNNLVNPGAAEICDGLDNNCDQFVDEGFDIDADTFSVCGGDCNDNDASVNPAAFEFCDNVDNNCDFVVDENFPSLGDVCVVGTGVCLSQGIQICDFSGTGTICNASEGDPFVEICDGLDNDCDGQVDEGVIAADDGNECTNDICISGTELHVPDRGAPCLIGVCNGLGECCLRDSDCSMM